MSLVLHGGQGRSLFVTRDSIRIVEERLAERHDTGIPIRNIAAVEVKKPGASDGFIQFSIAGGKAHDHAITFSGSDEYDIALKIKLYIESWPTHEGHTATDRGQPPLSAADEIRKLKALHDDGILTSEEFTAKKKLLLLGL